MTAVRATIDYLRLCRQARALGYPTEGPIRAEYSLTRDPEWLVDMAINRRAGWSDDPTLSRGSAMPVNGGIKTKIGQHRIGVHLGACPAGVYPKRAAGDWGWREMVQLAGQINGTRVVKRECEARSWPRKVRERLVHRIISRDEY